MGHKVHPTAFRIGVIRGWQAKWYADKDYSKFLHEDLKLRETIQSNYHDSGISLVEIDHQANKVSVTIHTARPGIVIGRGGQRVEEIKLRLERLIGKKIQLNTIERVEKTLYPFGIKLFGASFHGGYYKIPGLGRAFLAITNFDDGILIRTTEGNYIITPRIQPNSLIH